MTIAVTEVRTRRDLRDFIALPHKIYAQDPRWIAPPSASVRRQILPHTNPFHREAFIEHFVARDHHGDCVGRIAAVIHPSHTRRHGVKAFFGCFEATNDERVARHLCAKVEAWASERGIRVVQGPCSYAMTQEAGLLLEGFDKPAVLLQAYNPPYYEALLRGAGYEVAFHMSTFRISRDSESAAISAATKRGDAVTKRYGLSARSIDMKRFDDELERIRLCYNAAFAAHPETVEISRPVFADQAREMKGIVDPRLVRIVERDGAALAFSVAVPNVYEILAASRGRLTLSLLLRWKRLLKQVRSMVVVMIGSDPACDEGSPRATSAAGVGSCLAAQVAHALSDASYDTVYTTWIHQHNWRALTLMRAIGAKADKRYGIFQKDVV